MPPVITINPQDALYFENQNTDDIYLITQFFIPKSQARKNELTHCLKKNIELSVFKKIFLINEKIYTKDEMGLTEKEMTHIHQIIFNNGVRMRYIHAFAVVKKFNLNGYIVISNSDIFFDNSLQNNIRKTSLSKEKALYALLRFEFNEKKLRDCKIFGPRPDSQDSWIFHSKFLPTDVQILSCNFLLGVPGCDNSLAYLFDKFGYKVYNEPCVIKTYHYHMEQSRNYDLSYKIHPPYLFITPVHRNI
jgi:hypothetical protein